jgi:NADPH:quinone reductase-like Zn-dependent oxidoreductase
MKTTHSPPGGKSTKSIVFTKYGQPDDLELKEIEKPSPKDDEVLVKIRAASVNDWDWGLLRGKPFANRTMFGLFRPKKLKTLGLDIAGQVGTVGKNVKNLQPGDEVFGDLSAVGFGGFAEYVCAPESTLSLIPEGMTFEEAAAIPQAGLLAFQGLRKGNIKPGQKVLINGGGGGAGTFGIQIAKSLGAHVTAVDSTIKLDIMRSLGADIVIDYTKENFTKSGKQYDMILDTASHHSIFAYLRALNPQGIFITVGGSMARVIPIVLMGPMISKIGSKKIGALLHEANKDLGQFAGLFEEGKVAPVIDKRYPLSKVPDALSYFGESLHKGKVIITMGHEE